MAKPKFPAIDYESASKIFAYDAETGVLTWRVRKAQRIQIGAQVGTLNHDGYLTVQIDGRQYLVHRLGWLLTYGAWPKDCADHINGIRTDNRITNLRDVVRATNQQNRKPNSDNKSGFMGVHHYHGKWRAMIGINGKQKYLGSFDTPELASAAYLAAKREHHAIQPVPRELMKEMAA